MKHFIYLFMLLFIGIISAQTFTMYEKIPFLKGKSYSKPFVYDVDKTDGDSLDLFIGASLGNVHHLKLDPLTGSTKYITHNFTSIYVGGSGTPRYSAPCIYDISSADGDLVDMLIGEKDGNISHYKIDPVTMTASLITDNFNAIDVGKYSAPFICDLRTTDGDTLDLFVGEERSISYYKLDPATMTATLIQNDFCSTYSWVPYKPVISIYDLTDGDGGLTDLFIGDSNGKIRYYELNPATMETTLISTDFNSLAIGEHSAPFIYDNSSADGDLLDLLVGERDGNINHYKLDPAAKTTTKMTEHFSNAIDVGRKNSFCIYDVSSADGDSLDLFIGEDDGGINHFKLDPFSMEVSLITENFNSINAGKETAPFIYDVSSTDGDSLDLFIGNEDKTIHYYKLDPSTMSTTLISKKFNSIKVLGNSALCIYDVSTADGDSLDLFVGSKYLCHYKLDPATMKTTLITDRFNDIYMGGLYHPYIYDLSSSDGDTLDLFLGTSLGKIYHYKLDPSTMITTLATESFKGMDVGEEACPAFYDMDNDGDGDLFCGDEKGGLSVYLQSKNQTSIGSLDDRILNQFTLMQNYPNPFNPTTSINYQIARQGNVQLLVYNMLGQKVRTLVNRKQLAGEYTVTFNAGNLSSGIYFYTLKTENGFLQTRKLVLMK